MSDFMLEMDGVGKTYNAGKTNEVNVLRGCSLTIARSEVVGLIAPSGAGKSTLLHIAGTLDVPSKGRVCVDGVDVTALSGQKRTLLRRDAIGFIYQFHHLLPEFTALENVVLPQLVNGVPEKDAEVRALKLLKNVGVDARANHRPAALSGGEQQRVAFCRALANQPSLLLADEPTGNLDPATSDVVFSGLMEVVRNEGLSALIATHNMELASKMDRVVRLRDGVLEDV